MQVVIANSPKFLAVLHTNSSIVYSRFLGKMRFRPRFPAYMSQPGLLPKITLSRFTVKLCNSVEDCQAYHCLHYLTFQRLYFQDVVRRLRPSRAMDQLDQRPSAGCDHHHDSRQQRSVGRHHRAICSTGRKPFVEHSLLRHPPMEIEERGARRFTPSTASPPPQL